MGINEAVYTKLKEELSTVSLETLKRFAEYVSNAMEHEDASESKKTNSLLVLSDIQDEIKKRLFFNP